ncbi:MAG: hypothetical protein KDD82_08720 [Planctomycetes bacterium]|nr:hypothetical protein [Planctomycetota bacterium]
MGIKQIVLLGALAFCFGGCGSSEKAEPAKTECVCETAKAENGWCESCGVGYVGGEKMECKACVDKNMETAGAGKCEACAAK